MRGSTARNGITLRVTDEKLGQLVRDLNGTIDLYDFVSDRGVILSTRVIDKTDPPEYLVFLDKHQKRFLERRMVLQSFADEYGEAKGA